MVDIELKSVSKTFKTFKAIDSISLEIKDKEYFIILGPTGAGKTTLLKIIGGLIKSDTGKIFFDGEDMTNTDAQKRNIGFMFENYALFPHMDVKDNIAFSGRVHAHDPEQTENIVEQVLMMTLLTGRDDALPEELSGGMKQRVALCRALMNLEDTKLLILDEPLKALDAGLKMSLRNELLMMAKSKQLRLTVIHVTNEEEEAMMLADRIAIMNQGKVIQVGTPHEIYYHPANLFVAYFMSEINYFEGICRKNGEIIQKKNNNVKMIDKFFREIHEDSVLISIDLGLNESFRSYVHKSKYEGLRDGERILLVVRANHMKIRLGNRTADKKNAILGKILRRKFMGVFYRFEVMTRINDREKIVKVSIPATTEIRAHLLENLEVTVYFPEELGIVFEHPGEDEIRETLKLE
jgi:ABC-type Fe3+/spermidine/putrescine transport system ATPase subunit